MKILDITQAYTQHSGGIRTYIHEKRRYIQNYTNHQHVLVIPGEVDKIETDENFKTYHVKGFPVPGCRPYRFIFRLDKVFRIFEQEKPDIIELGSAYILPFTAFQFRKKKECSIVGFYHTDFPAAYVEPVVKKCAGEKVAEKIKNAAYTFAGHVYNRCDATIASSPAIRQKLVEKGIGNVVKIPLGVDIDLFNPSRRNVKIRSQMGLGEDQTGLIYAGRLDSEKRVDHLLESFDKISPKLNGKLTFVGQGPMQEMVVDYTKRNAKINFIPYERDRERLADLLASSDIYITAGPHETFALSVIEAQSCGLAVLGVKAGALEERVPEHVGVLVQPGELDAMASNIYELATNGFRQKGINARKLVEENYTWEKTFLELFGLYEKLYAKTFGRL